MNLGDDITMRFVTLPLEWMSLSKGQSQGEENREAASRVAVCSASKQSRYPSTTLRVKPGKKRFHVSWSWGCCHRTRTPLIMLRAALLPAGWATFWRPLSAFLNKPIESTDRPRYQAFSCPGGGWQSGFMHLRWSSKPPLPVDMMGLGFWGLSQRIQELWRWEETGLALVFEVSLQPSSLFFFFF